MKRHDTSVQDIVVQHAIGVGYTTPKVLQPQRRRGYHVVLKQGSRDEPIKLAGGEEWRVRQTHDLSSDESFAPEPRRITDRYTLRTISNGSGQDAVSLESIAGRICSVPPI